jgi:hypothetical protein
MNPNPITVFLNKYSTLTHVIAAALVFLIGAYAEVPQFHAYVNGLAAHLPAWASGGISAAIAVYLHYRNGAKQ